MSAPQRGSTHGPQRESERRLALGTPPRLTPLVLTLAAAAILLHQLQNVILPFVIAAIVAYLCAPLVDWLAAQTRMPRWPMALVVFAGLLIVAALLGFLGLPPLLLQLKGVVADLHGAVADLTRAVIGTRSISLMGSTLSAERLADVIVGGLHEELTGPRVLRLVAWTAAAAFGYLLVWVLLAYFLLDRRALTAGVLWLVPPKARPWVERIWRDLDPILRRYFIGVALVVAYASTVAYFGLALVLRLQHAAFLALLTGLLEAIPLVGPLAAAVLGGLVAVRQAASSWDIAAYVVYVVALRLSIDQLVGPIVLGKSARLRPVVVIFCFLVGGSLFGVVGVILSVPAALAVKSTLSVLYEDERSR